MPIIDPLSVREPDIGPVPPDEIFLISGWFVGHPEYILDALYKLRGKVFVEVSSSRASAFDPPDTTVFRYDGFNEAGEMQMVEFSWNDGSKS